ncbi:MAG: FMN-binding protein [Actinomycetota bacterium]|nr:FMN-binding protein [Actinomycetota bacterium]
MRRPVMSAMAAVSVAVLGLSVRSSQVRSHLSASGLAPAGVVGTNSLNNPVVPSRTAVARPVTATHKPVAATPRPPTTTAPRATQPTVRQTVAPRQTTAPPATTTRTVNGAAFDTRYGPVQVQIKVQGRRIVSADAIVYPQESQRDQEINAQAVPQLNDETLKAQSAQIDTVSGATYTSDGYRQSLQSAIDAAHTSV